MGRASVLLHGVCHGVQTGTTGAADLAEKDLVAVPPLWGVARPA